MVSLILPKKQMKLTIPSTEGAQNSEFRLFFGTIQDAIIGFRDLLTFNYNEFQPEIHREMVEGIHVLIKYIPKSDKDF